MNGDEFVKKCCNYIKSRQEAVVAEYSNLQQQIQINMDPEISGEAYAKNLKSRIKFNLELFNNFFVGRSAEVKKKLTTRLFYNPMDVMLTCSLETLDADETIACQIADGSFNPTGYNDTEIPLLGAGNFWGSSDPAIYGNILYLMSRERNSAVHLNKNSSFFHVTPLQQDLATPLLDSEYLYQNDNILGLGFVHTGYAQTGSRLDSALYDTPKAYAPKDCSQYVQEMLEYKNNYITEDMLYAYRHNSNHGFIRKNWLDSPVANELCNKFTTVPIEDVQPGDIHVKWDFRASEKPTAARVHIHGHTTIVFSKQGSEVLTLGDGQTVPYRDGFGLETYSMQPTEVHAHGTTETRFFRPKV